MNKKNSWIAIFILAAGLAGLLGVVGLQYATIRGLAGSFATQHILVEALQSSDILQQRQLTTYSEENAALKKEIDDLRASQKRVNPASAAGGNFFAGSGVGNTTLSPDGGASSLASYNTGFGKDSLYSLTTGFNNAAFGYNVLGQTTTGGNNSGFGANALGSNRTGANNTAIGSSAMYRNTSGTHNTALGLQAHYNNTTGSHNTSIGRDSGFSNTTGNWNTNLGVDACPGTTTGSGNTCVGGEAGYTNNRANQNVTGSNNVWLGYQTGPANLKQVSNSVAIGYRAKNTESNQTVIGNAETKETIIFGDLKIERLCVGATCADAGSFAAMLQAKEGR